LAALGGAAALNLAATPFARADVPAQKGPRERMKLLLERKEPVTWLFTGDSITHGALHTHGWRSYPELFAERVRFELRRMRDIVINTGISGDTTAGLLADIDWRILHLAPDVVSIMLGMNDCNRGAEGRGVFQTNLEQITRRAIDAGAVVILNTPNTIYLKNAASRADLPAYAQIVRDVAKATGALLIDHWRHWSEAKPQQEALLAWIEDQSIHPGVYGHRAFARLIYQELMIFDPESASCKLEIP
jgi:lysophospholipase L1-like esterase